MLKSRLLQLFVVGGLLLSTAGCGHNSATRAITGGALGAGGGALVGGATGVGAGTGALIGGGAGAIGGAATGH